MAQSDITVVMAKPIVTIVLPQCTTVTSQIVTTIDVYVAADVPATSHIKLIFLLVNLEKENLNQDKPKPQQ